MINPARLVEQRAENNARIRYLLEEEEKRLRNVIAKRFSMHLPSFDVALNTGMRKSEQFTLQWPEVSLVRKRIHLNKMKNGSDTPTLHQSTTKQLLDDLIQSQPEIVKAVWAVKSPIDLSGKHCATAWVRALRSPGFWM
jgi:integrase